MELFNLVHLLKERNSKNLAKRKSCKFLNMFFNVGSKHQLTQGKMNLLEYNVSS